MRSRLGFSTAMRTDVDLLLIDETLAVGDRQFRRKAEKAMMDKINGEQTVVFVSHNAGQVSKVCSRALWLEDGVIQAERSEERRVGEECRAEWGMGEKEEEEIEYADAYVD